MRYALLSALVLPAVVVAHANRARDVHHPRQAPSSAASASVPASGSATSAATGTSVASGASSAVSGTVAPTTTLAQFSFSLPATNPTAIPISSLSAGTQTTSPTLGVTTTYAAGTTPTFLPNAPPLPDISKLVISSYPALDKPPPTDSPEVQAWIQEVAQSGVQIPNLTPSMAGGCAANPTLLNDPDRCWWTCGGCTDSNDVVSCPEKLHWGMSHDDGPAPYTPNLLQYLDQNQLRTTFFAVGSRCLSYPSLLQEEYMAQHQIAVHTWSHPQMTTLSNDEIIAELGWSKKIIKDVLGVTPTYWRPPFGDVDNRVRAIARAMNLATVIWTRLDAGHTFDTNDFNIPGGTASPSEVVFNWQNILNNATQIDTGFIVLEHDLFVQQVEIGTGYILPAALAFQPKLTIEPIITCLNKPLQDAYAETNDNTTNPPIVSGAQPVTLSSGAPGSAEATGGAQNGDNSGALPVAMLGNTNLLALTGSALLAVAAGARVLF